MTVHEALTTPQRAKLTVDDFLLLADAGAFDRYTRTELIEGEIWVVNAVHRRHAHVHAMLTVEIGAALKAFEGKYALYTAPSTKLSDISLPEPDIAIAEIGGEGRTVSGSEIRVAIEISDSTLSIDLGRKARLYAKHGVPEYWVADVEGGVIHQMWRPGPDGYSERAEMSLGSPITACTVPGLIVETVAG